MANDTNKVILIGRLTRDPELKTIGETSVAKFSLAVGSSYKKGNEKVEETSFFECEVWGKLADVLGQYATKGKKASKVKIRVENFQLLGGKSDSPNVPNSIEEMGSEVQDDSVF